jgi:hypothetical protein
MRPLLAMACLTPPPLQSVSGVLAALPDLMLQSDTGESISPLPGLHMGDSSSCCAAGWVQGDLSMGLA